VLAALDRRYSHMLQTGHSPAAEYARHVETLGRSVQLQAGDEVVAGVALRVEDDGALVLGTASGERVIRFGDVVG
jgi:biotin-(acetyl-CoA carboxylase) ligase